MTQERAIRILAGTMVLISLGLGFFVSPWWYLLTVFVGVNLIQSGFTGFCPPLRKSSPRWGSRKDHVLIRKKIKDLNIF